MRTDPLFTPADPGPGWSFFVPGAPITQGSKRAGVNPHTGRAFMREQAGGRLTLWRHRISNAATAIRGTQGPLTGPVAVDLYFAMPRPKSLPKRRRTWPIGARSGDVDKLCRAAFDAMTGILFADDSQVVRVTVWKDWEQGQGPGVSVTVLGVEP